MVVVSLKIVIFQGVVVSFCFCFLLFFVNGFYCCFSIGFGFGF